MPENAAVSRVVQIGPETTAGTAVAATKKLGSLNFVGSPEGSISSMRAAGSKYPTAHAIGKESMAFDVDSDAISFDELQYVLCGLIKNVTPTVSDTSARTWTFAPTPDAEDTRKTFTVEEGHSGASNAHKAAYCLPTSLTLECDRDGTKLKSSWIGRQISTATLTASLTSPPQVPILGKDWAVYLDTTAAGLGTTLLTRVTKVSMEMSDLISAAWFLDDTQASWTTHIETPPKCKVTMEMEKDSTGMALLPQMRSSAFRYLRVENTSDLLAGAATAYYKLTCDFALQISGLPKFSESDDLYVMEWEFEPTTDPGWPSAPGKPFQIALTNKQASL